MLEVTPNDILKKDWAELDPTDEPYCTYTISENNLTLYVGKSDSPFNRVCEHFTLSPRGNHHIQRISKAYPEVLDTWKVRLFTALELGQTSENRAEKALIRSLCPCLNTTYNDNPSELPEKYQRLFDTIDDSPADKFFLQ